MSEMNYFLTNKLEGETPLEALEQLRIEKGIDPSVPMTYAGRLDPMAEGLLLILIGDECKKKDTYFGLDKEYEVEVLLGVGSDTGDVLGIIKTKDISEMANLQQNISAELIQEKIKLLIGKRTEKYPAYSSKPVNGKPLFVHARQASLVGGNLDDIEIPEKEIEIYSVNFCGVKEIGGTELIVSVHERISKVHGDFRQPEIMESWKNLETSNNFSSTKFSIIKIRVKSSSGAYMRTLAEKFGISLGTQALAWSIKRTKIGNF